MRKIAFLLILVLFSFIGCKEEEKPLTHPYGIYKVESMVSAIPVDFTNSGEQITEHVANFSWCGTGEFSIEWRLNKQTPVMDFDTFIFFDRVNEKTKEREIFRGCGFTRSIKNWHLQKGNDIWFLATVATNPQRSRREIIICPW